MTNKPGVPALDVADVIAVIRLRNLGATMEELAEAFDLEPRTLYRVLARRVQCGQCPAAYAYATHLRQHVREAHAAP